MDNGMPAPSQAPGLDLQAAGDELLVHDTQRGNVHVLNATAARALLLCDGAHAVDDIVEAVRTEFGAERATVAADVAAILATFRDMGLIQTATPAA